MDNIEKYTLIITDNINKNNLIKKLSKSNKLCNTKIMTTSELLNNYYFSYDDKSIYYLMNKYSLKYDIARIYIKNMYYINSSVYNDKINNLYNIKQELIENKLLTTKEYFKEYLNSQIIATYNLKYIPNIIKNILDNYKYDIIENQSNNYEHQIYEFNTLDEEVSFVASKCIELINSGVDINNIYLTNLNDEYRLIIKRFFSIFNIPICLNDNYSIYNTKTSNTFLELYESNINNTLEKMKEMISKDELDNYNKIVSICNKYVWCDNYLDIKEIIINDLKNNSVTIPIINNSVKESDISNHYDENDYVFILGFNQGIIPVIHKDEDYLSDSDKQLLNIETSIDLNIVEKNKIKNILNNIENLIVTYKLKSLTESYSISNINEELNYEIIKDEKKEYKYSNLYNKLILSKSLDLFNKYGTINDDLKILYGNYRNIEYRLYNNKFKGINIKDLHKYLDNKLLLSYSSLDNYNRCNFRYYLNNILKINTYEESFMQFIGNLFHYVLSKAFLPDFDFDECFDSYIDKELTKKEQFFINKLKKELVFIIDTIKEHNNHSSLDNEMYEEKVYIDIDSDIKITFMGIIDKLKYKEVDDRYIVAIIDYKTGNPNLNLNNVIHGIEMQLPIYIYLAKNHPKFNKIEVAGFCLQKILNNEITADGKNNYEDLKKKNLLLQGYSNENINILEYFDNSFSDSKVVKSLKTTAKGFYAYSKVIDNSTLDKLVELTEEKIKESALKIINGEFDINPKKIGANNLGCEFCPFSDVCFKTEKDIKNLKEYKDLEFLGGDDNGMD